MFDDGFGSVPVLLYFIFCTAYNPYARLLPKKALDIISDQEPWSTHIGGDDLANTFAVRRNAGTFIPLVSPPPSQLVFGLDRADTDLRWDFLLDSGMVKQKGNGVIGQI